MPIYWVASYITRNIVVNKEKVRVDKINIDSQQLAFLEWYYWSVHFTWVSLVPNNTHNHTCDSVVLQMCDLEWFSKIQ